MILETKRLSVRNYNEGDFDRVHLYASLSNVSEYEPWGPNSETDTRTFIANAIASATLQERYQFEFALCLKANHLLIGGAGIRRVSQGSQVANIGYVINPSHQKQGFATEVTRCLIDFGRNTLGVKVIYATCDVKNIASIRVLEKAGMQRVGRINNHMQLPTRMRDSYRYEVFD